MQKNYLKAQIFTFQTLVACIIGQSIVSFSTWLVYIYLHLKSELTSYNFSFYCFSFYCNVRSCIHLSPDERFLSTMFISWSVMHSFQHQITCRKAVFFSFFFFFFYFKDFSILASVIFCTTPPVSSTYTKNHIFKWLFLCIYMRCSSHDN